MFTRIQEAKTILTHSEPEFGPDAVIVERKNATPSRAGEIIADAIQFFLIAYVIGFLAGKIGSYVYRVLPQHPSASLATIIGALGFMIAVLGHRIRMDVENRIRATLDLGKIMAPYFGNRLTKAIRIMRGSVRAS